MFKKAVRSESKLRLAIAGPSGSGKTYTALAIASGLTDKPIALVDTENGSASKYADDPFVFDVAEMHEPFHPNKFITAIQEAADAGYGVIILDSLSHAWVGPGGLLDIVDEAAKANRGGNSFTAWKSGTPIQNKLVHAIVSSPIHIIATMRSKTDYVLKEGNNGKMTPEKVGMAAIQRDGMEYEFDIFLQMTKDNEAIVEKSRCSALAGRVIAKPGKQVADTLKSWLAGSQTQQPTQTPAQRQPNAITQASSSTVIADPTIQATLNGNESPRTMSDVETLISGWGASPPAAQDWAVKKGLATNEYSARTTWSKIVKDDFDNKCTPNNMKDIMRAFATHYLNKQNQPAKEPA